MRGGAAPQEPVEGGRNVSGGPEGRKDDGQSTHRNRSLPSGAPEVELAFGQILGLARSLQPQATARLVGVANASGFGVSCPQADSGRPPTARGCDGNG